MQEARAGLISSDSPKHSSNTNVVLPQPPNDARDSRCRRLATVELTILVSIHRRTSPFPSLGIVELVVLVFDHRCAPPFPSPGVVELAIPVSGCRSWTFSTFKGWLTLTPLPSHDLGLRRGEQLASPTKTGHLNYEIATTTEPNTTYGTSDCKAICWSNCSCTGFKQHNANGTGCTFFSAGAYALDSVGEDFYMLGNLTQHNDKSTAKSQTPGTLFI
ncbi:hypothetical protein E2542_SST04530 [Spatholobus suberectus]|nr:hypothetical protein E2542_SST04530 [Spatholobus suberectus]